MLPIPSGPPLTIIKEKDDENDGTNPEDDNNKDEENIYATNECPIPTSVAATEKDQPTNEAIDSGEKDGEEHKSKDGVAQSSTAPLAVASKGKEVSSAWFGNL